MIENIGVIKYWKHFNRFSGKIIGQTSEMERNYVIL